jgi:hypothetical protein
MFKLKFTKIQRHAKIDLIYQWWELHLMSDYSEFQYIYFYH